MELAQLRSQTIWLHYLLFYYCYSENATTSAVLISAIISSSIKRTPISSYVPIYKSALVTFPEVFTLHAGGDFRFSF